MSIDEEIRFKVLADAQVVSTLSSEAAWGSLKAIGDQLGVKSEQGSKYYGLVNGYKWVIATALLGILDEIIRCSELWGLEPDERLQDWWRFYQSGSGVQLQSAITNLDSQLGSTVLLFDTTLGRLRSANGWEQAKQAITSTKEIGEALLKASQGCVITSIDDLAIPPTVEEALKLRAFERLLDYLDYEMKTSYRFIWRREDDLDPESNDDFWLDSSRGIETHSDMLPSILRRHAPREMWGFGSVAAICILIKILDGPKEDTFDIWNQFHRFTRNYSALLDDIRCRLHNTNPSEMFRLNFGECLQIRRLVEISRASQPDKLMGKDKLAARLGSETRLIASNDFRGGQKLRIVVAGIASTLSDGEKIEIIKITHPRDNDNTSDVSLAVRVEKVNALANTSMWWVFYRAYTIGRIFESDQKRLYREIKDTFAKFEEFLEVIDLKDVSKQDLLDICEPPVWRYVFSTARTLVDENAALRGAIPELLTSLMFTYEGYQNIKTSFKDSTLFAESGLRDVELDVIGVKPTSKGNFCVIAETKGQATTDIALESEIKSFGAKLKHLRGNLLELANALDFNGEIIGVEGCFISMGDIDGFGSREEGLEVWDFKQFVIALKRAGVPRRYTDLLRKLLVAKVVNLSANPMMNSWIEVNTEMQSDYSLDDLQPTPDPKTGGDPTCS